MSPPAFETPPEIKTTSGFIDRKSTRLNSSHLVISYAVFCLKKKKISIFRLRRGPGAGPPGRRLSCRLVASVGLVAFPWALGVGGTASTPRYLHSRRAGVVQR